jgi:hypothetical protein
MDPQHCCFVDTITNWRAPVGDGAADSLRGAGCPATPVDPPPGGGWRAGAPPSAPPPWPHHAAPPPGHHHYHIRHPVVDNNNRKLRADFARDSQMGNLAFQVSFKLDEVQFLLRLFSEPDLPNNLDY